MLTSVFQKSNMCEHHVNLTCEDLQDLILVLTLCAAAVYCMRTFPFSASFERQVPHLLRSPFVTLAQLHCDVNVCVLYSQDSTS